MKLPSKFVDISQPLDNETVVDPDFMRPSIRYVTGKESAAMMCELFPGLKEEQLPGGEGWAIEFIELATHNGTHMDAPYHYNSRDSQGNRMPTIDEMPLDWYFRPGVKLDLRHLDDGYVATPDDIEAELKRIGYELQPMDIVLVNTRRASATATTTTFIPAAASAARGPTISPSAACASPASTAGAGTRPSPPPASAGSSRAIPRSSGRALRRDRHALLPHGEAQAPGGAAALRLHGRVLPLQDQGGLRRLDQGRRALRLTSPHPPRTSPRASMSTYLCGIDIGGTFTDCVVVDEAGRVTTGKAPSTPSDFGEGLIAALDVVAGKLGRPLDVLCRELAVLAHGTTVGTNAIIQKRGAKVGLITTKGHNDVIHIMRGSRGLTGRDIRLVVHIPESSKPDPIVPKYLIEGVSERVDCFGKVVVELNEEEAEQAIRRLVADGVEALAICFLWSFLAPEHEQRVKAMVERIAPDLFVTCSSELVPKWGEYERTAAVALNAYIGPLVTGYLARMDRRTTDLGYHHPLQITQCAGGTIPVAKAMGAPLLTLDSGPVSGVTGSRYAGGIMGYDNVITTDMGGTSFDVGIIHGGEPAFSYRSLVHQYEYYLSKVDIQVIGAGGGSMARIDEATGAFRVGPESAGADPGPVCYGRGGTVPTVTDADLVLGYLDPDNFAGGAIRLDRDAAAKALAPMGERLRPGPRRDRERHRPHRRVPDGRPDPQGDDPEGPRSARFRALRLRRRWPGPCRGVRAGTGGLQGHRPAARDRLGLVRVRRGGGGPAARPRAGQHHALALRRRGDQRDARGAQGAGRRRSRGGRRGPDGSPLPLHPRYAAQGADQRGRSRVGRRDRRR